MLCVDGEGGFEENPPENKCAEKLLKVIDLGWLHLGGRYVIYAYESDGEGGENLRDMDLTEEQWLENFKRC